MAEYIRKLCHKAFSVTTLPRTAAVVKEPKMAEFEPNSATAVGGDRVHNELAENARFSPVAKMLTVASCDALAKKGRMGICPPTATSAPAGTRS